MAAPHEINHTPGGAQPALPFLAGLARREILVLGPLGLSAVDWPVGSFWSFLYILPREPSQSFWDPPQ